MRIEIKVSKNWFGSLFNSSWVTEIKTKYDEMYVTYKIREAIDKAIIELEKREAE